MKSSKLFIFHFAPIEQYPPIQNLLNFLESSDEVGEVICFSTHGRLKSIEFESNKIKIIRLGVLNKGKLALWLSYVFFNLITVLYLLLKRPKKLVYFETISSMPAALYKRYINEIAKIYIHYHEYSAKSDYENSSALLRFFHSQEKKIYDQASWISHTNDVRLNKFLKDEGIIFRPEIHKVMPNYPSRKWVKTNEPRKDEKSVLKLIYVGFSLTKKGSYLEEVVTYLAKSEIPIELNIYCMLPNDFMHGFKGEHGSLKVTVNNAVSYEFLPDLLKLHHVGLILYRALIPNYIYNAPNKLFEYLSCGLDVWYPNEMQGIHEYDSKLQPKVLRLDYNKLENYSLADLTRTTGSKNKFTYFAEEIYARFLTALKKN